LTQKVLPEDVAVYEIKMTEIPKEDRGKLKERIDEELQNKIDEIQKSEKVKIPGIKYGSNWRDSIYPDDGLYLQMEITAKSDNYETLTKLLDTAISGLSILSEKFYSPHSIRRCKDFGSKSPRNRPVGL
jgi:hypothetical protein